MKKSILIVLLILITSASVFGADRTDMIILLDNSVSVLPYYDNIQNSLIKRIISEHLLPGDTFSLITFADYPEVEISREIRNDEDISEVLAYSAILQPMGNHTDLVLALRFLYKYALDLPLNNRKKIVILTDGIHDPPPGSSYIIDSDAVRAEIEKASADIHREGWDVSIVELEDGPEEIEALTGENRTDVIDTVSQTLGSKPSAFVNDGTDMAGIALGIPLVGIPSHLGESSGELKVPLSIKNRSNEALLFSLSAVNSDGNDILAEKASIRLDPGAEDVLDMKLKLPAELAPGEYSDEINLKLIGGLNTEPKTLKLNYTLIEKGSLNRGLEFILDWRVIAVIVAIIIAVIIILLIKRAGTGRIGGYYENEDGEKLTPLDIKHEDEASVEEKAVKEEESEKREPEEYLIAAMASESEDVIPHKKNRPVQMLVYGQNTKLGISNVKWLGLNKKRSIGSSSSSIFRIFFIKVPSVIAHIECTGDDFILTPVKEEFFPDLSGPLHNCLNKKIKIVSQENKMFYIEFRQWISELEKLNRLLSMTKHSGSPDMEF
ncbi:MAG: VWA domain-containing protein [Spirochaetales bacterium]|uniref:VWA domain-containing protein n=1 Tax=Candidatus Thalassospirochaeta sargassi TaxID=3119039 RepID=A0AAJ1IEC3_9SPIO|nr:VWA domain-containing protein [Spirochaetales bacterium]